MEIAGYLLAALVGVSLGLIGGGGSILTVPILVYILGFSPSLATFYSLFIVGAASLVGAADNYRKGYVNIRIALIFGVFSVASVIFTRNILLRYIPDVLYSGNSFRLTQSMAMMLLFALLMIVAAFAMIGNGNEKITALHRAKEQLSFPKLVIAAVLIGLVTGLLGAGGGFLLIPVLVLILHMPMKQAVGTSLFIIALNSLIGFAGDLLYFRPDWSFLMAITSIAIAGIFIGGYISKKADSGKLKTGFGWFILLMAVVIIVRELFFTHAFR